jgi:nucleoside-diphosphate-sugar epimerase
MRALVTGATGFLGQRLVRQLLETGAQVRCLLRPSSDEATLRTAAENMPGTLELLRGNLGRSDACAAALDGCDVVFHTAAELRGAPAVLFASNVIGTRALAEASLRAGVRRFVLVSSLAVYGTRKLQAGDVLNERCPLDPEPHRREPYTYSKVAQEGVAWQAHRERGLPLAVVRPGVIYGPGRDCLSGRVGLQVGRWLIRMGGGAPLPYTFVDNCAAAVRLAGTTPGVEGEAFNIIDDDPPTARELLRKYRSAVRPVRGVTIPNWAIAPLSALCEWYHRHSRGQLPAVLTRYKSRAMWLPLRYDNSKAKAVLGWAPQTDFTTGLGQTFAWLKQQAA